MALESNFIDYYDLLGVDQTAETAQIKASYFKLAKDHHPDAGGSTEQMQLINQAYKVLTGETTRAAYDKLYNLHNGTLADDLELKDDYDTPSSKDDIDGDLADMFLDQTFAEYYEEPKKKKRGKFKDLFGKDLK